LKDANIQLSSSSGGKKDPEVFYAVLAQAFVGKSLTSFQDEDPEKIPTENLKFDPTDKHDSLYLCKDSTNNQAAYNNHWFALNDPKRVVYLALVAFTTDKDNIKCSACGEQKPDLRFCHNDNKYFCSSCDDEYHNKSNYAILKKHRRTNYMSFSLTYPSTCPVHTLKPYEFYCLKCKAVYCIKDLTDGDHKNLTDHEVKHLTDVYNSLEQETKSLTERIRQINNNISAELDEREKCSK
jgi:hypothetical protein